MSKKKQEKAVPVRNVTPRAAVREALQERPLTARELGKRTGLRDREVEEQLEHLARSLAREGDKLVIKPATCLACEYVFASRERWTTPSRCPKCRSERIAAPSFHLDAGRDTPVTKGHSPLGSPGLDPGARSRDDAGAMAGQDRTSAASASNAHDAVLSVESSVSAAIFSTSGFAGERHPGAPPSYASLPGAPPSYASLPGAPQSYAGLTRVATGTEALHAAASAAREGKRTAAVLSPGELLGALDALHAIARARAPVVVHVLGSSEGASACAGRDEIPPALDTGAGVVVTWNAQESVDLTLAVRRAAEDAETPFLLVTDGGGPVMTLPGRGLVEQFLGGRDGGLTRNASGLEGKRRERSYAARVPFALAAAMRELGELTGRPIGPVERYETTDAEEVVVAIGQGYTAARAAAEALRREGRKVGAVGVRVLRPFFSSDLVKAVSRARAVAVIEPLDVALAPAGPLATCLKAAFADALTWAPGFPGVGHIPPIVSVVFATLAGCVTEGEVREALGELLAGDRAKRLLVFGSDGTG
jgi:pyruvate-ferredoxin/flavodoxin oxidoreductase